MENDFAWFDLAPNHGVMELHERLTAHIGLELHVVVRAGGISAWWERDDGRCWVRDTHVGLA